MIEPGFIKAQVAKSAANRQTSSFLRRLVFSVVDEVAVAHYGAHYPTRCLQVSAAVRTVLERFGIRSSLWVGAVCVAEVFEDAGFATRGGFWDQDHHLWLTTEYDELVDLSISQIHRHPRSQRSEGIAIPAVWWSDLGQWPPVIRYLPDAPVKIGLQGEDVADLSSFQGKVMAALDARLATNSVQDTAFARMLCDVDGMNEATRLGDPWLTRAVVFVDGHIPFPDGIQQRERQLNRLGGGGTPTACRTRRRHGRLTPQLASWRVSGSRTGGLRCRAHEAKAAWSDNLTMTANLDHFLDRLGGPALLAWHRENGTAVPADAYLGLYRDRLLRGLDHTLVIYLDTNFWVRLRDAARGTGSAEAVRLLQTLRTMVRRREALCVSQIYSLLEVGKQEEQSLRVTAELLDELTEGVAIASTDDLLRWECAQFVTATVKRDVTQGLCPWTKVGQIHKNELPALPGPTTVAGGEAVLKAALDSLWNLSFEYAFERLGWDTKNKLGFQLDDEVLANVEKRKAEQLTKGYTLDQVRANEFEQQVHAQLMPVATELLRTWHTARNFPEGLSALLRDQRAVEHTAVEQFKARSLGKLLPGLSIMTELYALYETDRNTKRPISSSDWFDSSHAAAALPYCDVFLTERNLAHKLKQMLKADVQYGCQVISSLEEALVQFCEPYTPPQ